MPNIKKKYDTTKNEFDSMSDIFDLYDYGVSLKGHIVDNGSVKPEENGLVLLDSIFSANGDSKDLLVYPIPDVVASKTDSNCPPPFRISFIETIALWS